LSSYELSKAGVNTLIILYILAVITLTGFMTPQYVCLIVIGSSIFLLLRLRVFNNIHFKIRLLIKYALIISILLCFVSMALFIDSLSKAKPQLVSLTLITSYISPIPLLTFLCIALSKYVLRNKLLITISLLLYAIGITYIPFEVSSGPLLIKELGQSGNELMSVISGEAGMLMSFSAPISLTLVILSMLVIIAILTKSLREYLHEISLSS